MPTLISITKSLLKSQKKQTKLERAMKKEIRELMKENKKITKILNKLPYTHKARKMLAKRKTENIKRVAELQKTFNAYLREERIEDSKTRQLMNKI